VNPWLNAVLRWLTALDLDPPRQFASVRKGWPPSFFTFRTILAAKVGLTWRKFPYSPKWSFTATLSPSSTTESNPATENSSSILSRTFPIFDLKFTK